MIWDDERIAELKRLYAQGDRVAAIAQTLGVTTNTIVGKVGRLKLTRDRLDAWTDDRIEFVKVRYALGESAAQIAKAIGGVTRSSVMGKLHRMGLTRSPKAVKVMQSKGAKMRNAQKPVQSAPTLKATPLPKPRPTPPASRPTPFMHTTARQCRFCIEPSDAPAHAMMMVCGAETVEGRPYCETHERASAGYQPARRIKPPFEKTVVRVAT